LTSDRLQTSRREHMPVLYSPGTGTYNLRSSLPDGHFAIRRGQGRSAFLGTSSGILRHPELALTQPI
jgi:hypothetical protein